MPWGPGAKRREGPKCGDAKGRKGPDAQGRTGPRVRIQRAGKGPEKPAQCCRRFRPLFGELVEMANAGRVQGGAQTRHLRLQLTHRGAGLLVLVRQLKGTPPFCLIQNKLLKSWVDIGFDMSLH